MHILSHPRFLVLPGQELDGLTRAVFDANNGVELQYFHNNGLDSVPLDEDQLRVLLPALPLHLLNEAMQAQIRESANPLCETDGAQDPRCHLWVPPSDVVCGHTSPTLHVSEDIGVVTCPTCRAVYERQSSASRQGLSADRVYTPQWDADRGGIVCGTCGVAPLEHTYGTTGPRCPPPVTADPIPTSMPAQDVAEGTTAELTHKYLNGSDGTRSVCGAHSHRLLALTWKYTTCPACLHARPQDRVALGSDRGEGLETNGGFGKLLRSMRQQAGMSLGDLARWLGVRVPYLSAVEHGHQPPFGPEVIRHLTTYWGVDPAPLLMQAAIRSASEAPQEPGQNPQQQEQTAGDACSQMHGEE